MSAETPIVVGRNLLSWAEKQWKITLDLPEIEKNVSKDFLNMPGWLYGYKLGLAWVLEKQGKFEEAKIQVGEATKVLEEAEQKFLHASVDANLMMQRSVQVGEEFEMRLDLVNVARTPASLTRIEGLVPQEFDVVSLPSFCDLWNDVINLKGKTVNPFTVETIRLKLKATKAGKFTLNPSITYADDQGKTKTAQPAQIILTVHTPKPAFEVQSGRIATSYAALDGLLLGGIPEKYAVVLAAPSSDEREQLIRCFLETGATEDETIFHITTEVANTKALAEKYPSNFYLFLCNPQADAMVQDRPNVFKLKGIENLTEIDIALTKAFRTLNPSVKGARRICLEMVSDILLQHHAINTRRWLSALLPTLKSKGFTILAVVDPSMHPAEDLQAVLSVFDGEIRVTEKETPDGSRQVMKVRKLVSQKYSDKEVILDKEKLAA
jgi:KaiC/GvpD/RAD55 family RecA-like ATPase